MKTNAFLLGGLVPLLVSCVSRPVALAPVGPDPSSVVLGLGNTGYLRVFSEREPVFQGDNPVYQQHSDYVIYDAQGKRVEYVGNTIGHFTTSPRPVPLAPGRYIIKARSRDYLTVKVPVVIKRAQTTDVHLDDRWHPTSGTPSRDFVLEPNGTPVGWKAEGTGSWAKPD